MQTEGCRNGETGNGGTMNSLEKKCKEFDFDCCFF